MPQRDFDAERRQRILQAGITTFVLGGDTYTLRPSVDPDAFAGYDRITEDTPGDEALRLIDDLMCEMILPSQGDTYRAARKRKLVDFELPTDATPEQVADTTAKLIDLQTLFDVVAWLVEQVTGRPFSWPDGSTPSSSPNGMPSTGIFDSEESTPQLSTSAASSTSSTP
jgi:hypothetical protein